MRRILLITTFLWVATAFGQNLEMGIYKGGKLPFTICYFTYSDSTIEVEYFLKKSDQIFGHIPPKKLFRVSEYGNEIDFKSVDDSITVFLKQGHLFIKQKGSRKIMLGKSKDTYSSITTLRNRNRKFSFSQQLYREYQVTANFDEQKFWNKLHSYDLDKYVTIDNPSFNMKLDETKEHFKNSW